jgi:hypothetical protein
MRLDWAEAWGRLLAPAGELVTVIYPVDGSLSTGPPWPVTPALYESLLRPVGECDSRLGSVASTLGC